MFPSAISDLADWLSACGAELAEVAEEALEYALGAMVILVLGMLLLSVAPALLVGLAGAPLWVVVLLLLGI